MGTSKTFDIDMLPYKLEFSLFTTDEIKSLSVAKVITTQTFDILGHPIAGGLYDSQMGTHGKRMEPCATCLNMQACPGHIGHIELNALVYNPFFVKLVQKIVNMFCCRCYNIQIHGRETDILKLQLDLIDGGYIVEAKELDALKSKMILENDKIQVKSEDGDVFHSFIIKSRELLKSAISKRLNITKTNCEIRSAILHSTFQRPLNKKCIHCHEVLQHVRYHNRKLVYFMTKTELKSRFPEVEEVGGQYKLILAVDMRKHLREVYKKYSDLLSRIFPIFNYVPIVKASDFSPVDVVFLDTILVTPPKSRPCNVVNEQIVEHPQTALYRSILENNFVLKIIMNHIKNHGDLAGEEMNVFVKAKGNNAHEKLYNAWQTLQMSVDVMIDTTGSHGVPLSAGLKQILEKKEGLIRKHMMGKRVNYAARTVITPDPNINVEEVGIPDIFAKKLSYPVHVTPWNIADLRKMVINGPNVHPGANYIQDERGYTTLIPADNAAKRESMAKLLFSYPENGIKIVHRHVLNGDVLLLNRQPSLHRPSIMAHKARILRGEKTFRLHYSNCKAYNADFDGDEMNAHIPQGEVARSEAYNLVNVANNYLVPKDGTPLGGLIQDHVISGVKLSVRGRFFNREDYQQLVFQGLSHLKTDIKLLPPAIIKPIALWSGKQILSTILINLIPEDCKKINLKSFAKISAKHWNLCVLSTSSKVYQMCESVVYIRQGELLTGVLDKQQYGATTFGLIHCMYELYGGTISTNTLTALTKLFTYFLQREGFSLGVKDILVTKQADRERREIIYESRNIGHTAIASELGLSNYAPLDEVSKKMEEAYIKNPNFQVILDRKYKSLLDNYTNNINKACLPNGLLVKFPNNNLQLMVLSGAKGSMVNTMQISSLLGQIELEGKRPPLMISGKSLPSFTSFETSPKACGFIDGRFMTGIQPQDFFFHCMAGREGLVDTAVKTSRSGYLQRCLIKHLEGLTVNYDLTVRDSDKSVVQYLYGEDGIDILKSKFFINTFGIKFLIDNSDIILQRRELEKLDKEMENLHKIQHNNKKIKKWLQRRKCDSNTHNLSAFTHFSGELRYEIEVEQPNEKNPKNGRRLLDDAILKLWLDIEKVTKEKYQKKYCKCPDPTNSLYEQDRCYGSVSEKLQKIIDEYMGKYPNRKQDIADIIYLKNMKSLISPGEPVGLLAAQSIGEPSTQMTLNTFHFAGRGEMNVTLGIPRLREILMMATTNIKTPSMDIPIKTYQEDAADKLRIYLNKVTLADVLQYIHVKTQPILRGKYLQKYELTFHMLPREAYKNSFYVKPKQIVKFIGERFFNILFQSIIKTAKSQKNIIEFREGRGEKIKDNSDTELDNEPKKISSNSKNNALADNDNTSSDEDQDDQIDATTIKAKTQKIDEAEYDEPDEVDEFENFKSTIDNEEANDVFDNQNSETSASDFQHTNDNNNHFIIEGATNKAMVESYTYDTKQYLWSKLIFHLPMIFKQMNISSIVKDLVKNTNIHQVHNINRAIMYVGKNNEKILKTDGINIAEIIQHHNILCINRLYTNDIHAVACIYGIEAAGQVIINEISNVFKVYGIQIDRRHLSLIADYMTFDGTFQPLSRRGMENSASPLQQMSFESCLQFLKNAVSLGCGDALNSPSARLMVGLPIRNGTGCFDILTNIL